MSDEDNSQPMGGERMLKWFDCRDAPEETREVLVGFYVIAADLVHMLEPGPERTVALRKLLESKDAAVRAKLRPGG